MTRLRRPDADGHRTLAREEVARQLAVAGAHAALRAGDARAADAYAADAMARLDAAGLPAGVDGRLDLAEAANLLLWLDLAGDAVPASVETGRRLIATLAGAHDTGDAPDLAAPAPRRFTVAIARTYGPTRRLRRLRLPLPIAGSALELLDLAVDTPGARVLADRIEATAPSGEEATTIAATISFVSRPAARDMSPPDGTSPWLAEAEGAIRVTSAVRALADDLAAGRAPRDAVQALYDYLLERFGCGVVHHDRIGAEPAPDWVLARGWYDCRLGAALLASLCRARGIPARVVGGYLLWDQPVEHYWLEAWIAGEGWLRFDLMAAGLSRSGRDAAWRGVYAGRIDHRMATQVFPRIFTGATAAEPVHRLVRLVAGGAETRLVSARDGALIHADTVRVLTA